MKKVKQPSATGMIESSATEVKVVEVVAEIAAEPKKRKKKQDDAVAEEVVVEESAPADVAPAVEESAEEKPVQDEAL